MTRRDRHAPSGELDCVEIFDIKTLVSYISQFMSLQAGDIIAIGTPAGGG